MTTILRGYRLLTERGLNPSAPLPTGQAAVIWTLYALIFVWDWYT